MFLLAESKICGHEQFKLLKWVSKFLKFASNNFKTSFAFWHYCVHKSIKSSSDKVRCVFFNCLLLNLDFIYAACLEIKKQKEEFKKKQPKQSALYKQCIVLFSFPSCHITAQLYLLGCLFSIAKQKGLRGSVPLVTCDFNIKYDSIVFISELYIVQKVQIKISSLR